VFAEAFRCGPGFTLIPLLASCITYPKLEHPIYNVPRLYALHVNSFQPPPPSHQQRVYCIMRVSRLKNKNVMFLKDLMERYMEFDFFEFALRKD